MGATKHRAQNTEHEQSFSGVLVGRACIDKSIDRCCCCCYGPAHQAPMGAPTHLNSIVAERVDPHRGDVLGDVLIP